MNRPYAAALVLMLAFVPCPAPAEPGIVLGTETDHVDVTTTFDGADIAVFGAIDVAADLVLKITGPVQDVQLSREVQRGPFWVGGGTATVSGAPSLVYLYSTKPIASLLPAAERARYGLALDAVQLQIGARSGGIAEDRWRRAFFRLKQRQHKYLEDPTAVRVARSRLVVSHINLPAELELGTYSIEALLVRDGKVVGHDTGRIEVRQTGIGRWVWQSAHDHAWLFGIACTLSAMAIGFVLNAALHRRR